MKYSKTKKVVICSILAVNIFSIFGCTTQPLGAPVQNNETSLPSKVGDLVFTKVSSDKAAQLNALISKGINQTTNPSGQTGSTSDIATIAPMPAASSAPLSTPASAPATTSPSTIPENSASTPGYAGSTSMPIPTMTLPATAPDYAYSPAYFGYPSSFEEYVMVDFDEAKKAGFTGSYLSLMKTVINPVIKTLASDARLVSNYGTTDRKGDIIQPSPVPSPSVSPYYQSSPVPMSASIYPYPYGSYNNYQWQFTYASNSKKEIYSILVSANETLILRQKWALKDLLASDIKIDSTEAIDIVEKAVKDKTAYPTSVYASPVPYYYDSYQNNFEYLYEIPQEATLSYNLEQNKSDLLWDISFSYYNNTNPEYYYSSGYAQVDARTGKIVNLQRIIKYRQTPMPTSYPYPNVYTTGAPGSASPSAIPTPAIPTPSAIAGSTPGISSSQQ